jgi:hypothetical protein
LFPGGFGGRAHAAPVARNAIAQPRERPLRENLNRIEAPSQKRFVGAPAAFPGRKSALSSAHRRKRDAAFPFASALVDGDRINRAAAQSACLAAFGRLVNDLYSFRRWRHGIGQRIFAESLPVQSPLPHTRIEREPDALRTRATFLPFTATACPASPLQCERPSRNGRPRCNTQL